MTNKNNYTEGLEELLTELGEPEAPVAAYSEEDDDAVTQLLESPLSDQEWMVQVSALDRRMMATAQLLEELAAGNVNGATLVWRGGMDDWAELSSIAELNEPLQAAAAVGGAHSTGSPELDASAVPHPIAADTSFGRNNTTRPVALDSLPDFNPRPRGMNKGFLAVGAVAVVAAAVLAINLSAGDDPAAAGTGVASAGMDDSADAVLADPSAVQEVAAMHPDPAAAGAGEPAAGLDGAELDGAQPDGAQPDGDSEGASEQDEVEQAVAELGENEAPAAAEEPAAEEAEVETSTEEAVAAASRRARARARRQARRRRVRAKSRKAAAERALVQPASQVIEPEASAVSSGGFDRGAVREKLGLAAAQAANCRPSGGPTGVGKVQVRYAPSGEVTDVKLQTEQFQNTTAGVCVRMLFRRASIPAFKGSPKTVTTSFTIPE